MRRPSGSAFLLSAATIAIVAICFCMPPIASSLMDQGLRRQESSIAIDPAHLAFEEPLDETGSNNEPTDGLSPLGQLADFNELMFADSSSVTINSGTRMTSDQAASEAVQVMASFGIEGDSDSMSCESELMSDPATPDVYGIFWRCAMDDIGSIVWIDDQSGVPVGFDLVVSFGEMTGKGDSSDDLLAEDIQNGVAVDDVASDGESDAVLERMRSLYDKALTERVLAFCNAYYPDVSVGLFEVNESLMAITLSDTSSGYGAVTLPLMGIDYGSVLSFNTIPIEQLEIIETESGKAASGDAVANGATAASATSSSSL